MKKNFLFKGVSVLGAMLLLANVVLPGLAYADAPASWTMYAIHANPVTKEGGTDTCTAMIGGGNQCQENGEAGTYTTDDGIYTIESSDGGKTLTYSNITLKEPGDAIAGQAWTEGRMSGHIYLGVRFIIPNTVNEGAYIKKGEKNFYQSGVDHVDRRGQSLTSTEVKDLVSSGTFTKEWVYTVSSNGTDTEEFKIVADLSNITIKDENDNILLQVVNKVVTKSADWTMYAIHANPVSKEGGTDTCTAMIGGGNQCQENGGAGTYTTNDGKYTIDSSDGGKTLTYSNITLKEPGDAIAGQAWTEGRLSGYIYLGVRFIIPSTVTDGAFVKKGETNYYVAGVDHIDRRGQSLTSTEVKDLVSSGTFTKEWVYTVSSNGTDTEEFKIVADLSNITIKDESDNILLEVKNSEITKINGEDAVKVTFDGANEQVIASGSTIDEPAAPTKDCNSFDGWYNGDEKFDFTTPITGNLALTSKWTYTCSRSSGGGGGGSKTTTTTKTDTTVTTGDNTKVDDKKSDEEKATDGTDTEGENVGEGNKDDDNVSYPIITKEDMNNYEPEQLLAYKWAYDNGITTMKTVAEARLGEGLTRAELAKMMVVYVEKILGKQPVLTGDVDYPDVKSEEIGDELVGYIKLAYQYQIMGIDAKGDPIEEFNPHGFVTRGEYATVFSRVLFGDKFNQEGEDFYSQHIGALERAGILNNTTPTMEEARGYVMLMMYRSSLNADKIAEVAAEVIEALGATEEEAADAQAKAEEQNAEGAEQAQAAQAEDAQVAAVAQAEDATAQAEPAQEEPKAEAQAGEAAQAEDAQVAAVAQPEAATAQADK